MGTRRASRSPHVPALALDAEQPTLLGHRAARWHRETLFGDTRDLRGLDQYHLISTTAIVRVWAPAVYSLLQEELMCCGLSEVRSLSLGWRVLPRPF